jgi:hypothetical protein
MMLFGTQCKPVRLRVSEFPFFLQRKRISISTARKFQTCSRWESNAWYMQIFLKQSNRKNLHIQPQHPWKNRRLPKLVHRCTQCNDDICKVDYNFLKSLNTWKLFRAIPAGPKLLSYIYRVLELCGLRSVVLFYYSTWFPSPLLTVPAINSLIYGLMIFIGYMRTGPFDVIFFGFNGDRVLHQKPGPGASSTV